MNNQYHSEETLMISQVTTLFDLMPDTTFFIKDHQLRYITCNHRLLEVMRVQSREDLLGQTDQHFFPAYLGSDIYRDDLSLLHSRVPIVKRTELIPRATATGFVDWCRTTKMPLCNQSGEVIGIIGFSRPYDNESRLIDTHPALEKAVSYIQNHFHEPLTTPSLANMVGLSPSTFLRRFKSCLEMTPREYIRNLRVQASCLKLTQTALPLVEIADTCGFFDQSHFSREFSRIMKEAPSTYRRRYRL